MLKSLHNAHVTVMGLGRFGGGLGATQFLAAQGARVTVTDIQPADKLAEPIEQIKPLIDAGQVTLHLGGHVLEDFTSADLVVANPAVPHPWDNEFLLAAQRAGVKITTEISLLIEHLPAHVRTLGVTGSVGKSTTTAMIAHALEHTGHRVALGGNIGKSLLLDSELLTSRSPAAHAPAPMVLLELSSFQLHWLGTLNKWSPNVSVCTNLAPNHLDWHIDMTHYTRSKQQLIAHQAPSDWCILGPTLAHWSQQTRALVRVVEEREFTGTLIVPGAHNRLNAAMAIAACVAADAKVSATQYAHALETFPGLIHRLQLAHSARGVRFFNDSKSTTPDATLTAIDALSHERRGDASHIHLIAGGYDKKSDLSPIAALAPKLAGLYCIAQTGPSIAASARAHAGAKHVAQMETLDQAMHAIVARVRPGDVVLLSPGCASWGQFINYEYRGERFIELAKQLMPA
jgi:UDP-N-acetylmuramoylalanine--D-glutamate ligase